MKLNHGLTLLFAVLLLGAMPPAGAQDNAQSQDNSQSQDNAQSKDNTSDAADVWATIEGQWAAEQEGDNDWLDQSLTDDFSGWPDESPAPRSKSSMKMWDRFSDEQGSTVQHELYPLAIVVHGDVAVAHYLYTSAFKSKDDKVEVKNGRFTDILVRTEDGWKFVAWHGGADD
jgi:ketosteroid isomerase-like protein